QAWQLLARGFPAVVASADDLDARAKMLLGAHLAGAAIENSMLGAAHALANPLSARFDVTHGVAIAVMLPHVVRYNSAAAAGAYGELAADARLCEAGDPHSGELLAAHLVALAVRAGLPARLSDCRVDPAAIPEMAAEASQQWTGQFNPRAVDEAALR